jgi:hypothetical protein
VSRRIYSMMLYPGLTLEELVSFQTFRNYFDFTAKKMGCMNSDPDVRTHFRYVVDKVKFMQKSKRYQKKYDLFITHDRSKVAKALCISVISAIRIATPNLRVCICTEKSTQQPPDTPGNSILEHAASSLNLRSRHGPVLPERGCARRDQSSSSGGRTDVGRFGCTQVP